MKCIYCGCEDSKVLDSRAVDENNAIKRRRECNNCFKRFTTYETIEVSPILVIKRSGERQAFLSSKIKTGIVKSCEKRPVSMEQIEKMVASIEQTVQNYPKKEISSSELGEMVMAELEKVDKVAYIRFASVYKQFEDVSKFKEFVQKLTDDITN